MADLSHTTELLRDLRADLSYRRMMAPSPAAERLDEAAADFQAAHQYSVRQAYAFDASLAQT